MSGDDPRREAIPLRPLAKAGIVAVGYLAALAGAVLVVQLRVAATNGPDRQQYAAMYDFGDSLLFLAVLGVGAIPATGAALYFLRPRPAFWTRLSFTSLAVTATGLAATLTWFAARALGPSPLLDGWASAAVLRILVAPLFVLFFLLSGLLAPNRSARITLLAATAIEAVAFAAVASAWLFSRR
ncbi:MAG: hypothetical protein ACHQ2E_02970 [Gemmatimonadales bacterium]